MQEHVLYFSSLCPDTKAFVEELQRQNISYREVDITASMANLKEFIRLRDDKPQFEGRKQWGMVGIPCLVVSETECIIDILTVQNLERTMQKYNKKKEKLK